MARQLTRYWTFARGAFSRPDLGAQNATPLEKPLLAYVPQGMGRVYPGTFPREAPYFAAPNLIRVGLAAGGVQQGYIASPGPLYQGPGQTYTTNDPATL
jgi:hypothetical protein